MKSGYLYVLVHPSDSDLYKIGVTTQHPEKRLSQHNKNFQEHAGRIVKETGEKWVIKTFIPVEDPYWAESVFWGNTSFADIPYRYGIEVERMTWTEVQQGLDAAKNAGLRPPPGPLQDHVYAYTASIRKRLHGRGITLLGHVRSMVSGKADFLCTNGHKWRTTPQDVGEGQGCPQCGTGQCEPREIRQRIGAGVICLLTHPEKPGLINIGATRGTIEQASARMPWGDWQIHRYRNVEEVDLAEGLVWEMLGVPPHSDREPIKIDLREAEDVFRNLIYVLREKVAFVERAREALQKTGVS